MKLNKLVLITLGLFILLSGFASASLTDDLISYWTLDNTLNDSLGTNHLTNNGATYTTSGKINGAYDFDGTNDNMVSTFTNYNNMSVSFWVKFDSVTTTQELIMSGATNSWGCRMKDTNDGSVSGRLTCRAMGSGGVKYVRVSGLTTGVWYYITYVMENTNFKLYINGALNDTNTDNFGNVKSATSIIIGQYQSGGINLNGILDEISLYNKYLTADEVSLLYNNGAGLQYPFLTNFTINTNLDSWSYHLNGYGIENYTNIKLNRTSRTWGVDEVDNDLSSVYIRGLGANFYLNGEALYLNKINITYSACYGGVGDEWGCFGFYGSSGLGSYVNRNYTENTPLNLTIKKGFYGDATDTSLITPLSLTIESVDIVLTADGYDTITLTNYNISQNGTLNVVFIPSTKAIISAYDILTNNEVTTFNITYNNTIYSNSETLTFPTGAGDYNLTFSKVGYYNLTQQFTLNASTNYINFSDVYQTLLNITYKDILNTSSVLNNNGTLNITYNGTEHYYTTTNGTFLIRGLLGNYSNIKARSDGYYYHTGDDFTASNALENITYYFYLYNSVWLYAKEFSDGTNISNFSVTIYNEDNTYSDDGVSDVKLNGLADGYYKVLFSKDGYYPAEYYITIEAGSFQTLTGYMVNSSEALAEQTIFTAQDIISTNIITGVTISMSKLINSSWVLVSSKATDITGRAQISYIDGIEYKFIMSKDGYNTREFLLMPLYDSYIIRLTPNTTTATNYNVGSWNYYLSNYGIFYDDEENNFDLSLSAGLGTLEYYIAQVSNQTATQTITCLNAYGCSDNIDLPIYNSVETDKVNVYLRVKEVGEVEKAFNYTYLIQDIYGTQTLWAWKDVTESRAEATLLGFSDLERVVIATILMLIVLGALATISVMVGAPTITITGIALIFMIYTLAFLTFVPFYSAHIVGLGALLIVFFGRGNL